MKRTGLAVVVMLWVGVVSVALAGDFSWTWLDPWDTTLWSDNTAWTLVGGVDAGGDGVPGAGDTAVLQNIAWANGYTVIFNTWSPDTLTLHSNGGNTHQLTVNSAGTVGTLDFDRTVADYGFVLNFSNVSGLVMTLTDYHETGTFPGRFAFAGSVSQKFAFAGDGAWRYSGSAPSVLAIGLDFSGASSMTVGHYSGVGTPASETISNTTGNGDAWTVGRADNGTQNWTADGTSHPLILVNPTSGLRGIAKVGSGDVNMADFDIQFNLFRSAAISTVGSNPGVSQALYQGIITANSLTLDGTGATASVLFTNDGHLRLDGQSGLQSGGSGTGVALDVVAGAQNVSVRLGSPSAPGNAPLFIPGKLEILPGGGDVVLRSTGGGVVDLNINNPTASEDTAMLVVNTIDIGQNAYISDINPQNVHPSGGAIDFRGSFINQSTLNTLFFLEHSNLTALTPATLDATFEAASQDLGLAGPGADNFLIDSLIIGGPSTTSCLLLTDSYDNSAGGDPEAVYVNNLQILNNSVLYLGTYGNPMNLYYNDGQSWVRATAGAFGDGFINVIPEPATGLLLLGGVLVAFRRRR